MAMKKKAVLKAPAKTTRRREPSVVELPLSTSIEVSYAKDGTPSVDIDPAMIVAGGEVIWHTRAGEQRAFKIVLKPGANVAQAEQEAFARAARKAKKSASLSAALTLQSSLQQVIRVGVPLDAKERMWNCVIEAGGLHISTGVLILGTNPIVRPPKPKNTGPNPNVGPQG